MAAKARSWDPENGPSGALPLTHPSGTKSQDGDGCVRGTCGAVAMPQDVGELWVEDPRDDVRVTQHQWHDGGSIHQCCRELRIRAWNGGSALRDIKNYE